MNELVTDAAKAGAVMKATSKENLRYLPGREWIHREDSCSKAVVKDIEADVKRLGDAYRIALKRNPLSANGKLEE